MPPIAHRSRSRTRPRVAATGGAESLDLAEVKQDITAISTDPQNSWPGGATGARIRLEPQRSWEVNVHMLAGMP